VGFTKQGNCSGFERSYRCGGIRRDTPTTKHHRFRIDGIRPHNTNMGRQGFRLTPPPISCSFLLRVICVARKCKGCKEILSGSCTRSCSCSTIQQTLKREKGQPHKRVHKEVLLDPFRGYFTGSAVMRSLATSFWSSVNPGS